MPCPVSWKGGLCQDRSERSQPTACCTPPGLLCDSQCFCLAGDVDQAVSDCFSNCLLWDSCSLLPVVDPTYRGFWRQATVLTSKIESEANMEVLCLGVHALAVRRCEIEVSLQWRTSTATPTTWERDVGGRRGRGDRARSGYATMVIAGNPCTITAVS